MSLSDHIKYLRAVKGGLTPWEIAEGSGVPARDIHLLEVKHRMVGENDAILERLASYFGVPVDEFSSRRGAFRKRLTAFLEEGQQGTVPVEFKLESGEVIGGKVEWFAREAIAVAPAGEGEEVRPYILQRGYVADWRRADSPEWDVESGATSEVADQGSEAED
ncbi:MAG: hypothetical protein ACJ78Q_03660 [Chloroflexia bacterium]